MPFAKGQLSLDTRQWHIDFADAIASRDSARYAAFMHENCSVQINNSMLIYSKLAIERAFMDYVKNFHSMSYEFLSVFGTDRYSVAEALFTYTCNDGSVEVVQHAYICERDEAGLLTTVRLYGDTSRIRKSVTAAND
jgi:ketosteroid isomerase-like protein